MKQLPQTCLKPALRFQSFWGQNRTYEWKKEGQLLVSSGSSLIWIWNSKVRFRKGGKKKAISQVKELAFRKVTVGWTGFITFLKDWGKIDIRWKSQILNRQIDKFWQILTHSRILSINLDKEEFMDLSADDENLLLLALFLEVWKKWWSVLNEVEMWKLPCKHGERD